MSAGAIAAPIDGTWIPVAAEVSGRDLDVKQLRVARLVIALPGYKIVDRHHATLDTGTASFGDSVDQQTLDLEGLEGPYAGRRLRAIVALKNNSLCVCYDLECSKRPQSWQAAEGQLLLSITYARAASPSLAS